MVRNSSQDALNETEYEKLLEATDELPKPRDAEAMFVLVAGGRLGMRGGEISHMRAGWINWDRKIIEIPRHEPCDCGYCRKQAEQELTYDPSLNVDEQLAERWKPKTKHSARAIPFDFSPRIEATIREFFEDHDQYARSRVSVNRRVSEVAEEAGMEPSDVYPHALRATAATWHAYRGVPAVALQSLMGWADLKTAQKYIRLSGGATAEALRSAHSS